jgi:hypothetical protein
MASRSFGGRLPILSSTSCLKLCFSHCSHSRGWNREEVQSVNAPESLGDDSTKCAQSIRDRPSTGPQARICPASDPLRTRWAIRADAFGGDRRRIQPVGDQIRCHSSRTVVQMELIGMDDEAIPRGDVVPAAAKNVMLYGGAEQ